MASQPRVAPRLVELALSPPWAVIGLSLRDVRMMFGVSVPTMAPLFGASSQRQSPDRTCVGLPASPPPKSGRTGCTTPPGHIDLVQFGTIGLTYPLRGCHQTDVTGFAICPRLRGVGYEASANRSWRKSGDHGHSASRYHSSRSSSPKQRAITLSCSFCEETQPRIGTGS